MRRCVFFFVPTLTFLSPLSVSAIRLRHLPPPRLNPNIIQTNLNITEMHLLLHLNPNILAFVILMHHLPPLFASTFHLRCLPPHRLSPALVSIVGLNCSPPLPPLQHNSVFDLYLKWHLKIATFKRKIQFLIQLTQPNSTSSRVDWV